MDGQVYLGRPWQPNYPGNNCKVLYKNTKLGAHIIADGWSTMSNTDKATNTSFIAYPKDNSMYEYNNYGPGENVANTNRRQLSDEDAAKYTVENVLDGWDTNTVVKKLSSYLDGSGTGTGGTGTGGTGTGGTGTGGTGTGGTGTGGTGTGGTGTGGTETGGTGTGGTETGGTGTGGTGTGGTGTGGTGTGGTETGGTGTGGTETGGTGTGGTTTSSSSSHHHSDSSSSSSSSTTTSSTASTTTTGSTTSTSTGNTTNVVSNVSAILGSGTQVSVAKEVQTTDGNKLTVTALVKDGKAAGLVIAAEKTSATTTIQVDTSAEVVAVYKYVPLLNKYIEVTDGIVIDKNTITLPTQANATYVAAAEKLATNNVISEGWAKVDNSWYMVDKTGNPLTGWQKEQTQQWKLVGNKMVVSGTY
jgi:hypothetical protein